MTTSLQPILEELGRYRETTESLKETILANLALIGEVPAPTFGEEERIQLILDRFHECMLQNHCTDEVNNALGIFPGANPDRYILVVAHADTVFSATTDHTLAIHSDRVVGPGVGDNSLGLAVLTSLPTLLDRLDFKLDANLILMAGSRSLGRGNLGGLRFFLENSKYPIEAGICIEGVQLGRLSVDSLGMRRGEISCGGPENDTHNSILTLNKVIDKIVEIPAPESSGTSIIIGSIEGGTAYNALPTQARLKFEIRSRYSDEVKTVHQRIEHIVRDTAEKTGDEVKLDVFAEREPGGLAADHPLADGAQQIMEALDITPKASPSISELSAFIDQGIPALTLGITRGEHIHEMNSTIYIDRMFAGVAQLLGVIQAIDQGICP